MKWSHLSIAEELAKSGLAIEQPGTVLPTRVCDRSLLSELADTVLDRD
jgi:hypothetical protein